MNEGLVIHWSDGRFELLDGAAMKIFIEDTKSGEGEDDKISGQVGSKGRTAIVVGRIKVIMTPREMSRLDDGEILVTSMTTPEFVPAMRRSMAIITDEGGITCHAAIVSRELNLPCIIGTKVATKVLKDGDMVEMDMGKGVIRVINS